MRATGEELIGRGFAPGEWKLKFPQTVAKAYNHTRT